MCTDKLNKLKEIMSSMESALVAFSGGVDSTFLLKIAKDVLDDRALAVTATSPTYPSREVEAALETAKVLGVKIITIVTNEFANNKFTSNPPDRCYWCKKELFGKLCELADEHALRYVLDGANHDDLGDHRPGMKAGRELGVRSPLIEAGLTKEDIRALSKQLGLPTWDKPSFACLASRFPYHTAITPENVNKVAEAENCLQQLGFSQFRVRHHSDTARIEILPDDFSRIISEKIRLEIISLFKKLGYTYVTLDLLGYRTGSMNEALLKPGKP